MEIFWIVVGLGGPSWIFLFFDHCGKLWIVAGRTESLRVFLCFSKSVPTVLLIHH